MKTKVGKYLRTQEVKNKLSETRKKLFREGKIKTWNKGLTKEDSRVLKNCSGGARATQYKPGPRPNTRREGNNNWKGGRIMHNGYVFIRAPEHPHSSNGYILEHRMVKEKELGRLLNPKEIVHHVNHVTTDNRPENLMIMGQGEHIKIHIPIPPKKKKREDRK